MSFFLICLLIFHIPAFASDLTGNIQLVAVQTENAGATTESLDQHHNLLWNHALSPYVSLSSSFGLTRFSSDRGQGGNLWREQVRPSTGLRWSHPSFTASVAAQRRSLSSNNGATNVVQADVISSFSTRPTGLPSIFLRHRYDEAYNRHNRQTRDALGQSISLTARQAFGRTSLTYGFNNISRRVFSSNLQTSQTDHRLSWSQMSRLVDDRLRIQSDYHLSHRRQTDQLIIADATVRTMDIIVALYAHDATPDLGSLDTLPSLVDGNVIDPTSMPIEIGRGRIDQNIGFDLGYSRPARGIYLYTDQPSGSTLDWLLYTSSDNLSWSPVTSGVQVSYSASFSRYEIFFDNLKARYFKIVNRGTNEIIDVKVTEIEALEEFSEDHKSSRVQTVHRASLGANYQLGQTVSLALHTDFRLEPGSDFASSRDRYNAAFSSSHEPSDHLTQTARLQIGWDKYHGAGVDERDMAATYSVQWTPLESVEFLAAANSRQSFAGPLRYQEINSFSLRSRLELYRNLSLQLDGRHSRSNLYVSRQKYDTWSFSLSTTTQLTRSLEMAVTTRYRRTNDLAGERLRIYRSANGSADWRLTRSISFSTRFTVTKDENSNSQSQLHTLSWRLSGALTLGAQLDRAKSDGASRLKRSNVRLNYRLSGRTNLYSTLTRTETVAGQPSDIMSWQIGLRSGF